MPTATSSIIEGTSLRIEPDDFPDPIADLPKASPGISPATAVLSAGCFWCSEAVYREVDGVLAVAPGYAGGTLQTADYETVSTGRTKHAEAIRITYDPARLTYGQLLKVFFSVAHDPTQRNRQGNDVGPQYRSAIFYHSPEQKATAEQTIKELTEQKLWEDPIVTQIEPLTAFYPAEDYHQEYYTKTGHEPYCHVVPTGVLESLGLIPAGR